MSIISYLWRIYCTEFEHYDTVISSTEPSICPTDSGEIDSSKTIILESLFQNIIADGNLILESQNALINIDGAVGINIGNMTGSTEKIINIGNATGSTQLNLFSGTGGLTFETGEIGPLLLYPKGSSSELILTSSDDNQNLTIGVNGVYDTSLNIISSGITEDAIKIEALNGGINMDCATGGFTLDTTGQIYLTAQNELTFTSTQLIQRASEYIKFMPTPITLGDSNATLTIVELLSGHLVINPTEEKTLTLPTASLAVAGVSNVSVGDAIYFSICNLSIIDLATIIISVGTGGTLDCNNIININSSGQFALRFTNVSDSNEAYVIYRIS